MNQFLQLYAPPMRAAATRREVKQILAELPIATTADLTPGAIASWVQAHPDRSAARTASLLRALAPAAKYAARFGYLDHSPFEFRPPSQWIRPDARGGARPRIGKSAAEIARVLELADSEASAGSWAGGRLQALVYLLAFTGVRKGEALTLQVPDVDLNRRLVAIRPKPSWRPKTISSSARIPIAEPLAHVMALWLARTGCQWVFPGSRLRGPWTGGPPRQTALAAVRALGERAGVPGLSILSFRKSIGTLARSWGIGPRGLMALLRHTNLQTQDWYDEDDLDLLREDVRKIRFPRAQ